LLKIPKKFASLELIDGQHRLFGFIKAEPATRKTFNLAVLGIANIETEQRTKTFVAINDKAKKVDPNLVAFLKYNPNEEMCQHDSELMAIKLVYELNRTTPFKNKIKLLDTGSQIITLKGFAGYDLKGLIGEKGLLRKYYKHNSENYTKILRVYFSLLKSAFPDEWDDPKNFIIFTNKGISAFLKLLRSILKTEEKELNDKEIQKYLTALKNNFKSWELGTLKKSYVGSQGWKEFHRDLVKAIKKDYKTFKE
jgi:DGQHR domain-containing protein